jgi:steroid delta-isomerase-like uncharacterized protein
MTIEENKAIVRRHFEEIWNQGRLEVADELVAADYLSHLPLPGQPDGIEGFKYAVRLLKGSFPDLQHTIEDVIAEGDKVATRLTVRGTHQALFRGIPATGRVVSWTGTRILRIREGKIAENWANWDDLSLMRQLQSE